MATYTQLQTADIDKIAASYQLEVSNVTPITSGSANSNYRLQTKQGIYMLTLMEERSMQEVQELARLLQWLDQHFFLTNKPFPTVTGKMVTEYEGKPVLMKKWIVGKVYENFRDNELEQIGGAMAQLHQIPVPDYLSLSHAYGYEVFESVIGKGIDKVYETWLAERIHWLKTHIPKQLPSGLIHGDLFFDNVLFDQHQLKAMIDFEDACQYYLVFDLGMGILGLCQTEGKIDLKKAQLFLKGYQQVRSLTEVEKNTLQLFVEYAAIATSYWRFWKYNIHTPRPDLKYKHNVMAQIANEVRMLPKKHFLTQVFG